MFVRSLCSVHSLVGGRFSSVDRVLLHTMALKNVFN